MDRRQLVSGIAVASVIGLSGCLNAALKTVTSVKSTPAAVSQSTLESTGYEDVGIEEFVVEKDVVGQYQQVVVTNHLTDYEKQVGIDDIVEGATASFSILSTPKLEVVGRTLNPVDEMSNQEIVDRIGDNYDRIENIQHDADETVTVLGQSVTKSRFVADARLAGVSLQLDIHLTESIERNGDFLIAVGVYPRGLRIIEANTIADLTEGITPEPASSSSHATEGNSDDSVDGDTPPDDSVDSDTNPDDSADESDGFFDLADQRF